MPEVGELWHMDQLAIFVKFYWNTAPPVPLHIMFGYFGTTAAGLSTCDSNYMDYNI